MLVACGPTVDAPTAPILQTEVQPQIARVGDVVNIEIDVLTPGGYVVEKPASPLRSVDFYTESLEIDPVLRDGSGLRHMIHWTLRPSAIGQLEIPKLQIPAIDPNGDIHRLQIETSNIEVRSTLETFPERETFFDIQPAPPIRSWRWLGTAGAVITGLLGLAWLGVAALRDRQKSLRPNLHRLANLSLERLRRIGGLDSAEARARANMLSEITWGYIAASTFESVTCMTPLELKHAPAATNATYMILIDVLVRLETERFAQQSAPTRVDAIEHELQRYWEDVRER